MTPGALVARLDSTAELASGRPTFALFLLAYALLVVALVLLVLQATLTRPNDELADLAAHAPTPAWRWCALALLFTLAGLPPFFFFLPKLALLAYLATHAGTVTLLAALALILGGWYVYLTAAQALGTPRRALSAVPRRRRAQPTFLAAALAAALLGCLLLLLLGDELLLWAQLWSA